MHLEKHNNHRIFGLDVVRAIAILLVLFSHLYFLIDSQNPLLISLSGLLGFAGVELFFVLSGFLIGTILLKLFLAEEFSAAKLFTFLKRRWLRTLPAYYVVLLLNILIAFYFNYDLSGWWKYFLFIQNFSSYDIVIFTESWSLSVEEWTYVITPLALFLSFRIFKANKKVGFLLICLILIGFFHVLRYNFYLNHSISDMATWNTQLKSLALYRIDAIVFGFLVAWANYFYQERLKKISGYLLILSGHLFFLQFVVFNVLGIEIATSPLYFMVFYFTFCSLTISLGLPAFVSWEEGSALLKKPITFVSKISYSLYLLHYSVVTVLMKTFFTADKFSSVETTALIMGYLVLVGTLSYLLYRFVEKPIMDLRERV